MTRSFRSKLLRMYAIADGSPYSCMKESQNGYNEVQNERRTRGDLHYKRALSNENSLQSARHALVYRDIKEALYLRGVEIHSLHTHSIKPAVSAGVHQPSRCPHSR
jgi:hypothetical protein